MRKIYSKSGYEVWMAYDRTAKVYELFASQEGGDYLGCFDTKEEALTYAKQWVEENLSN